MEVTAQQYILNKKNSNTFVVVYKSLHETRKEKADRDADIYILFRIFSQKKVPLPRLSKFVVEAIVDGYMYSISKTTNEALKESVNEGITKLKSLIVHDKELEETGIDISFSVVLVKKEGLYVGRFGEDEIYVCKKNKCINISQIMNDKKANTAGIVLEDKENLILSTAGVLSPNIANISVYSQKDSFGEKLNEIGKSLPAGAGLLYLFAKDTPQKTVQNIDTRTDNISTEQKPSENQEYIPTVKKQTVISNIKSFLKRIFSKIWIHKITNGKLEIFFQKISFFFKKIFSFLGRIFTTLTSKIFSEFRNKKWFKRVGSKLSEVKINTRRVKVANGMRIDGYKVKNLRSRRIKIVILGIAIIALLAFGINFTINLKEGREISKLANEKFDDLEKLLDKAEGSTATDSESAETFLFQVNNMLKEVPANLNEEDRLKLDEITKRNTTIGDNLYKKVGVSETEGNLTKFLDPRLAFGEGSDLTDVDIYMDDSKNEYLVISDTGRNAMYRVSLSDSSVQTISDDDGLVKEPKYISAGVEGVYIYDEKGGVLKAPFDDSKWFTSIINVSGLSQNDIDETDIAGMIVLTDSDNVYLLSRDSNSILKSSAAYSNRYSLLFTYIENDSFVNGTDIMGDLSVYVLTNNSQILRYSWSYVEQKQMENPLTATGFNGEYGNITSGYTYSESMNSGLYMYDADKKRVLRFEKPMEGGDEIVHPNEILLLKQYEYRGSDSSAWSNVKDLVVDSNEKNMYVVEGSMIWRVSL